MIPLFSTKQVREIDKFAITKLGIPGIILMENAAKSIYDEIVITASSDELLGTLGFICGKGNNGGDGFAAARHFSNNGFDVLIIYLGTEDTMSEDCFTNFRIIKRLTEENKNIKLKKFSSPKDLKELCGCSIIVDAILGSGISGELKEPYKTIVEKLNDLPIEKHYRIAVDIPTGLDADKGFAETAFKSDLTITLGGFKKGLFFGKGSEFAGKIVKGDIGINENYFDRFSPQEFLIEPEDAANYLPKKDKSLNKYTAGKVFTIAGSGKLPGAAALTSKSVLRIGAGASILAFPKSVRNLIQKKIDEVIVESYNDNTKGFLSENNLEEFEDRIKWADAVSIGPGLGREEETQKAVLKIIKEKKYKKMVIDADGIYALSKKRFEKVNLRNIVFTPHHGEFANLLSISVEELSKDLLGYGRDFTSKTKVFLVLKGAPTLIFNPKGEVLINTTGNPGMAKFGTGDVLTGVIAGLMSQIDSIENALISAVYIHSLSADLLTNNFTEFGYTASDIITNLPHSIKFLRDSIV